MLNNIDQNFFSVDLDGDSITDEVSIGIEENCDGTPDSWLINSDDTVGLGIDTDDNGIPDYWIVGYDTDNDDILDKFTEVDTANTLEPTNTDNISSVTDEPTFGSIEEGDIEKGWADYHQDEAGTHSGWAEYYEEKGEADKALERRRAAAEAQKKADEHRAAATEEYHNS